MRELISADQIQARIAAMAGRVDDYYRNERRPIVVIGVLSGALFFMTDLIRKMKTEVQIDFIRTSTYPGLATVPQMPKIIAEPITSLFGTRVLLIDDILDTGVTLSVVKKELRFSNPEDITTAVLLRKPGKATNGVVANFVGFDIPDKFVFGYGLDRDGLCRELPYITDGGRDEFRVSEKEASRHQ